MAAYIPYMNNIIRQAPISQFAQSFNQPQPVPTSPINIPLPAPMNMLRSMPRQIANPFKSFRSFGTPGSSGSFGFRLLFKNPYVLGGLFLSLMGALIVLIYFGQSYAQSSPTAYWLGFSTPICSYILFKTLVMAKRAIIG